MSASVMVCTSDRFARRADGKADSLERVMMVFEDVSERNKLVALYANTCGRGMAGDVPLHKAPQIWHVRIASRFPAPPSSRFPQSVQKTSDPMAAISGP